jgi:hypothetical protein
VVLDREKNKPNTIDPGRIPAEKILLRMQSHVAVTPRRGQRWPLTTWVLNCLFIHLRPFSSASPADICLCFGFRPAIRLELNEAVNKEQTDLLPLDNSFGSSRYLDLSALPILDSTLLNYFK